MLGLIIFGTKGVTSSTGGGTFDCPGCGPGKPYEHKKVRRFFTLYYIPLIPLETKGEFIECGSCRQTWKPEVLARAGG
jgi:hypothetical protein